MTKEDIEKSHDEQPKPFRLGHRHLQCFILFFATIIAYGMRTNLSVGVVAMTKNQTDSNIPTYPEWEDKKNLMLSSFFWGYVCLQIGAGQLAEKFGPKLFLGASIGVTSLFSILIPVLAAAIGYQGVILCRVFQGLSQGFMYPSLHHLLSQWTPLSERAKLATFIYTGGPLGTVISNIVTGQIANSSAGWPAAFYLYGGLGFTWALIWIIFGADCPANHRYISEAERKYIESETSVIGEHKKMKTPWKSIATSLPMWAILIGHAGQNWGFWTLMDEIPSYMDKILKFDMKNNGLMSALPYLALWLTSLVLGPIADYLITNNITSIGASRKIFNSLGLFIPAAALIGLSFVNVEEKTLAVALLVIAVGANSAVYCGFNINHIDLSPNHAATLMGITNSISNILSIIAPLVIDNIKTYGYEETDKDLWTIVFCLAAGIYCAANTFYIFFASGEIQPWDSEGSIIEPSKTESSVIPRSEEEF